LKSSSDGEIKMRYNFRSNDSKKGMNILIMETHPEIKALYKQFFNAVASDVSYTLVDDIRKIRIDSSNTAEVKLNLIKQNLYDIIILDINAGSYDRIEIAKEIFKCLPQQRLIFTTTTNLPTIRKIMSSQALPSAIPILQKPFKLSQLLSLINSSRGTKFDKLELTDHVLASYNELLEELMDAVDFIRKGIDLNELNLLLIRSDMDIKNTVLTLESKGLSDIRSLLEKRSLIIIKNEEWYIPDGKVDKHRIISQWHDLVNQSIQSGKKGLRAFCMMDCFFENGYSMEVVDYESTLPSQFQIPFIPICAYRQSDLDCLPEPEKKKLMECHNHIMVTR
jgi:DNA-binding response OmpR family regulator